MTNLDLSIGTIIYYKNKNYKIIRQHPDYLTLSIQAIDNKTDIIDVLIEDISSKSTNKKIYLDIYTDSQWEEATTRYEIIKGLVFRKRTLTEVEKVAKNHNYSSMTIYRWIKDYESSGKISSLVSNKHKRGKKGSRLDPVLDKIINDVIEELYLNKQRNSFSKIYTTIKRECKKLSLTPPHQNTINTRIKNIDPELTMRKRYSYKKANHEFGNFEGVYPEGNFPLEVYQIDHTPLDIILVDSTYRKPIGRPYLTIALDVYSRMIAGFYLSLQAPGYFNVSQCLYMSFLPKKDYLKEQNIDGEWEIYGIPSKYAVDNGKDLIGLDMQRVCNELGMTMVRRPVGRPQFGGHVERLLGTINKQVHNLEGTTFSNIEEKGEYNSIKNATYTLGEMTKWLTEYIVNIYHKTIHHGIGMTPKEKYRIGIFGDDENPGTGIPSTIENKNEIKIALLPTFYRTIQKNGITLDGISYYSDVLRTWINKKDDRGNKLKFKIKRDPLNIQKIYFYDPQLEEYFDINYRNLQAPVMTIWDMNEAKKYLKNKKIKNYNEDDIFEAYDRLEKIEKEAKLKNKKIKLRKNKTPTMKNTFTTKKTNTTQNNKVFNELFENIQEFDISEN